MQPPAPTKTGQLLISATTARSSVTSGEARSHPWVGTHILSQISCCLELRLERASFPSLDTEKSKRILVQGGRHLLKALTAVQFLYRSPASQKRESQRLDPKALTRTVCKQNLVKSQGPAPQPPAESCSRTGPRRCRRLTTTCRCKEVRCPGFLRSPWCHSKEGPSLLHSDSSCCYCTPVFKQHKCHN